MPGAPAATALLLALALSACPAGPEGASDRLAAGPEGPSDRLAAESRTPGAGWAALAPGATVARGTQLRLVLGAARDGHVAVAAVDSGGSVVPYHPVAGGTAPIRGGPAAKLPSTIGLTAPPGALRLVALFCDEAPPVEPFWALLEERRRAAGGDPRKMEPLGLESCRDRSLLLTVR